MGLFGDYISQDDLDQVEVKQAYGQNEDGIYTGIVDDAYLKEGTDNHPDKSWIIIEYELDNGTSESEWFQLPEEAGNPTSAESIKLSYLIRRLGDLGISRERVASFEPDEVIGTHVAITLRSSKGKGKNSDKVYQNVTKLSVIPIEQTTATANSIPSQTVTNSAEAPARAAGGTRRPNPAARRA